MSEWNVGQTGTAGAGTRTGLTGALMLRFGADTAAPADAKAGKAMARPQAESFSDILKDRTAQTRDANPLENQGSRVSENRKARNDAAAVTRRESRPTAQTGTRNRPSGGTDSVNRSDSSEEPGRAVRADAVARSNAGGNDTAVTKDREIHTGQSQNPGDVSASPDVEEAVDVAADAAEGIPSEVLAKLLNDLYAVIQAAIAELAGPVEADAGTVSDAETVQADISAALSQTQGTALSEEVLALMRDVVEAAETASQDKATRLPSPLEHVLKNLLEKLNRQEAAPASLTETVVPGRDASLLAHLQHIARELRELVAPAAGTDTDMDALPGDGGADLVVAVTPQAEAQGAGADSSGGQAPQSNQTQGFTTGMLPQNAVQAQDGAAATQATGFQAAMSAARIPEQSIPATAAPAAPVLPQMPETPESARAVANQVVTRLETMSGDERHEMELQLKPESLGKIQLRIVEERGMILAKFTAESEKVRAILESNMQLLRDSLEKNGLTIQELSVSVGQQQPQSGRDDAPQANGRMTRTGIHFRAEGLGEPADGSLRETRMSQRVRDYLYGPDSTMSLKA